MEKVLNWIKRHRLLTIGIGMILFIFIFLSVYLFNSKHGGIYGDRCKDRDEYAISTKEVKKVKDKIREISEVNKVDIYTKLCTVKIIINIEKDVDIEAIKTKSSEILGFFSEDELKYYDFSLYVNSDDEESKTYPINVTKHKSEDNFAW